MNRAVIRLLTFLLFAVMIAGCRQHQPTKKVAERLIVFGADNSGYLYNEPNSEGAKKKFSGILETILVKQKGSAMVRIYRFALDALSCYEGTPKSVDEVFTAIDNEIINSQGEKKLGTQFSEMLNTMAEDAASTKLPVYGVILSDGAATDLEETKKSAEKLANVANFHGLLVVPVINGEFRTKLRKALTPLKEKVTIRSMEDLEGGVKDFCTDMKNDTTQKEGE